MSYFKGWSKLDFIWLFLSNFTILALSIYWGDNVLSIISAIAGVINVILVSKQMISNYYFGIIGVSTYAYIAFQSKLYGDFMLNAFYYLPMQFVGIYMWNKAKEKSEKNEVESRLMTNKQRILLTIISALSIGVYSAVLKILGGNIPIIDATSTVLSVIAMILMVKQYVEQWHLWVIINGVSILMWVISLCEGSGDLATLLMWIIYLLNSVFGLVNWQRASKKNI